MVKPFCVTLELATSSGLLAFHVAWSRELNDEAGLCLRDCVDSFEKLDVLLCVHRRGEPIHPRDIASELGLTVVEVQGALQGLCDSGVLVQQTSDHVREPDNDALRAELSDFVRTHHEQPLAILATLSRRVIARAPNRLRHCVSARLRGRHPARTSAM